VRRYDRAAVRRLLETSGFLPATIRGWGLPFGRVYDRCVLRTVVASPAGATARIAARLGRARPVHRLWRALFRLDELFDAGERGSGWWVVGRKAVVRGMPPDAEARD
jgi:hypothetical protein